LEEDDRYGTLLYLDWTQISRHKLFRPGAAKV